MNALDRVIAAIAPAWALARARQRMILQAYEAADTTRHRTPRRQYRSGDAAVKPAGKILREQARALDEDHDLVVGILDTFVANTVGPWGIQVEPQPRTRDGEIHEDLARAIQEARRDWCLKPETTHELDNGAMERLLCLTWARDGEAFGQHLSGNVALLDHGTRVPYSIELMEPDLCPIHYDDLGRGVVQGVERNAWGRPRAYWFYLSHPGDGYNTSFRQLSPNQMKRVASENVQHLKLTRRIRQARGVSLLTPILNRIQDLKDYEDAERIAAKIASANAFYIKKGQPDLYDPAAVTESSDGEANRRLNQVAPGMMWVDLQVGEEAGTIDVSRPSNLLFPFREAMLRAAASGTRTGYSSISRNYSGTYSAQRQELVEQFVHYTTNQAHFISQWTRPVYLRWLAAAIASREIRIPADVDPLTLDDAEFRGPVMPWIDPMKEAQANISQVQAGFKSRAQVIRERGGVPQNVANEIARERRQDDAAGLIFSTDYAHSAGAAAQDAPAEPPADDAEPNRNSEAA